MYVAMVAKKPRACFNLELVGFSINFLLAVQTLPLELIAVAGDSGSGFLSIECETMTPSSNCFSPSGGRICVLSNSPSEEGISEVINSPSEGGISTIGNLLSWEGGISAISVVHSLGNDA